MTGFFWPRKYGSNELFLCRELSKRGHDVSILTARKPNNEYALLRETVPQEEYFEGFRIERFSSQLNFGNIQFMPSLFPFLLKNKFDLIHAHEFFAPCTFYSAFASKIHGCPLIITQHNDQSTGSFLNDFLYKADALTSGKAAMKQASSIIALSENIKNHLVSFGAEPSKIEVIPNAVDTEKFKPNGQNYLAEKLGISHPVVLFVGRFIELKGIRYLMEAFSTVLKEVPEAKLVLVGNGPQKSEIRDFQNRFRNNVFLVDSINHDEMPKVYAGCDALVAPSLEERFGNSVIEAMAAGKPVIGTYVGGMKETIVHGVTGFHVPPRNSKLIAKYLIELLRDEHLIRRLGRNARLKATTKYSNTEIIKKIESIYLSVGQS